MNVVNVTQQPGQPSGTYATMFFVRGPYNPASGTAGLQPDGAVLPRCHGGEANEMNGGHTIPTTF